MVSTDRPLTHINKKGRPVSQCTHCRGLRKSRAAHVKCDCGEKSHTKGECIFAERGGSKSELVVTMIPVPSLMYTQWTNRLVVVPMALAVRVRSRRII